MLKNVCILLGTTILLLESAILHRLWGPETYWFDPNDEFQGECFRILPWSRCLRYREPGGTCCKNLSEVRLLWAIGVVLILIPLKSMIRMKFNI